MGLSFVRKTNRLRDDLSWLDSRGGVDVATTLTLDAAAFSNALVVSGTPVARKGDKAVPYNPEGLDGTENLYGFVLYARDTSTGDEPAAVQRHGDIYVANLPVDFTPVDHNHFTFA